MKKTYTPEQKSKRRRRRVIFLVTLLLIIAVFVVALGIYNCWWIFDESTHPIMIERKFTVNYIWGGKLENIEGVYPIYNVNDEIEMYMLVAEPDYYVFVKPDNERRKYLRDVYRSDFYRYRYTMPEDDRYGADINWQYDEKVGIWREVDESGERIAMDKGPYEAAGIAPETKKYIIWTQGNNAVPAVKIDGEFINLISMQPYSPDAERIEEMSILFTTYTIGFWSFL